MFKITFAVATLLCIDYLLELFFKESLIRNYMIYSSGGEMWFSTNDTSRMGIERVKSFARHGITFGIYCVTLFYTLFYHTIVFGKNIVVRQKKYFYTIIGLLALGVILSNSRSPFFFFIAALPMLLTLKGKQLKLTIVVVLVVVAIMLFFQNYVNYIFDTIFNENQVDVQGSTSDLRMEQLMIVLSLAKGHEMLGIGLGGVGSYIGVIKELAGAESNWFSVIGDTGYIGVATHLFLYLSLFVLAYRNHNFKFIIFFTLGYLITSIITSTPGFDEEIIYCIIVLFYYWGRNPDSLKLVKKRMSISDKKRKL